MRKKKKKNILTAVLLALIIASIAAIVFVSLFHWEAAVKTSVQKKRLGEPEPVVKEKQKVQGPAHGLREKSKNISSSPPVTGKKKDKEKIIIAKIVPPRLPLTQVAIIIDDIGYDMKPVHDLLRIDADITFAILPLLAHSREAAEMLHQAHRETLLHLPMEPLSYPKDKPGSGALFTDMNEEEIVYQLEKNLASVPHVVGVNNHMGSKFMTDQDKLTPVFQQLKKRNLFFIDSRTTQLSKAPALARTIHLTVASRKIFLDNERDYDAIYRILLSVAASPPGSVPMIIIGHPYPETIRAIRDANRVFQEKGISIIPVSELLKQEKAKGAS